MRSLFSICFFLCIHLGLFGQEHLLLKNIGSGPANGIPQTNESTTWNGVEYFIGLDEASFENDIWSTDGTPANTKRVVPSNYPDIFFLTSVKNGLLFNAWVGANRELYVSNGTPGGTQMIADFPGQEIIFLEALNDSIAIFITRVFVSDITSLWATDGTSEGTINLGEYEVAKGFIRYSFFNQSMILTEKSTGSSLFQPVFTDGTPAGTMLVTDYINSIVTPDLNTIESAVGTIDHLFVQTSSGGKVFDGATVNDISLGGHYFHGFKLDHLHVIFADGGISAYNSANETVTSIPYDADYFSEPVSSGGKVYFHDSESFIYETDGTIANTRKISSASAGFSNLKPYIFANEEVVIYNVVEDNVTSLRIVDLTSGVDSVFSIIRPSGVSNFTLHIFNSGDHILYTRATSAEGREYWSYSPLETGILKIPEVGKLSSFPNPATHQLVISIEKDFQSGTQIEVVNVYGQRLNVPLVQSQPLTIDISALSEGIYWISIQESSGASFRSSFVKQ